MTDREKLVELLTDNLPRIGGFPKCDNPLQYTSDEIVERIADHLLANGVIVLPCKVGDTVYWLSYNRDACADCGCYSSFYGMDAMCDKHYELWPEIIDPSNDDEHCPKHFIEIIERKTTLDWIACHWDEFGKTVFLTREEAEAALKEDE